MSPSAYEFSFFFNWLSRTLAQTHLFPRRPIESFTWNQLITLGLPRWCLPDGASGQEPACQCRRLRRWVQSLGWEYNLEEGKATHSRILAWRIPWTEEPGEIQSIAPQSDWVTEWLSTHVRWCSGKESACQCRRCKRHGFNSWVRKMPWRRKRQLTPVFLPGKFHGQRSLVGYSPWDRKESQQLSD